MDYVIDLGRKERKSMFLWAGMLLFVLVVLLRLYFGEISHLTVLSYLGFAVSLFSMLSFFDYDSIRHLNFVYVLLILWCGVMYLRSGAENYLSVYRYGAISYLPFLFPCLSILPFIKSLFKVGKIINAFFIFTFWIPLVLFSFDNGMIQSYLETFATAAAFIFLTNKIHSQKLVSMSGLVLFLAFLVSTLLARRNLMLTFGLYIMFGSTIYIFNGKLKSIETKLISVLVSVLLLIFIGVLYLSQSSGAFSKITNRASENTRQEVFLAFAVDMFNVKDLTIGRGMYGTYYNPGVDIDYETGESNEDRGNIECGYLQCILKGGVVYMLLYITLFIIAGFHGIRSKNQFCKGCAIIVFVQLLDMFPFGLHDFNTKTFMIWLALSVCLNKNIRNLSDEDIKFLIYKKKNIMLSWQRR